LSKRKGTTDDVTGPSSGIHLEKGLKEPFISSAS